MHQVVHDMTAGHISAEAVISHRKYYLGQVAQDREDWLRIQDIYAQLKHAWTSAQPPDMETALLFL